MRTPLKVVWLLALITAVLVLAVEWTAKATAVEAYLVSPKDKTAVELNKATFAPDSKDKTSAEYRREVMGIYGSVSDTTDRVLFVPREKFTFPDELPGLVLLPVEKARNENPLQLKTVIFVTRPVSYAALFVAFITYIVWRLKRRMAPPPPVP